MIFGLFKKTRVERVVVELPEIEWGHDDARAWRDFLETPLGKKAMAVLMSAAAATRGEISPSAKAEEITYQAGVADGLALAVRRLGAMVAPPEKED